MAARPPERGVIKHITPFRVEPVLEERKLLCLEAWDGYLLAGLSDGALLLVRNKASAGEPPQWRVSDAIRSFARRHVLQLAVAHSKSMLLSLTEDGVSAHVLPSLRLKAQALRTKGANLFSWDDATGTLCVAVKRRLLVFKYDGLEIMEQREVGLPDSVHSMQLAGNFAYVGLRQEYVAVDVMTGALVQLFASKAPHTCCTAVRPILASAAAAVAAKVARAPTSSTAGHERASEPAVMGAAGGTASNGPSARQRNAAESGSGAGQPAAGAGGGGEVPGAAPRTPAGTAGVLLTRDMQSVLMGLDGRLSRKGGGVAWSQTPRVVTVTGPYAVAGLEPTAAGTAGTAGGAGAPLEVRLLQPLSSSELLQRLSLPSAAPAAAAAAAGGGGAPASSAASAAGDLEDSASSDGSTAGAGGGSTVGGLLSSLLGGGGGAASSAAAVPAGPAVMDVVAPSPAADGSVFVGCKALGLVARLVPATVEEQAGEMLHLEEYEEALYLAALIPDKRAAARDKLRDDIHLRYGQQLFGKGEYDEALAHFGQSTLAGPVQLLALFPSLAPQRLLQAAAEAAGVATPTSSVPEPSGDEFQRAVSTVLPYLLSYRSRLASGLPPVPAANGTSQTGPAPIAGEAAAGQESHSRGPQQGLSPMRGRGQEAAPAAETSLAAGAGTPLSSRRSSRSSSRESGGSRRSSSSSSSLDSRSSCSRSPGDGRASGSAGRGAVLPGTAIGSTMAHGGSADAADAALRQLLWERGPGDGSCGDGALAILLDTAVLKALLTLPDSGALLRFVQRPNCVDVEEGEAALKEAGRYSELVALYQGKGRHGAALDLLQTLSQSPSQLRVPPKGAAAELRGLPGVWAAVRYLSSPATRDLGLITTHAKWILVADPDAGLEMFASMHPPLPPSDVLPILTSYAPQLAATYLEAALASGAAERSRFEHELAVLYLLRIVGVQQQQQQQESQHGQQRQQGAEHRQRPLENGQAAGEQLAEAVPASEAAGDRVSETEAATVAAKDTQTAMDPSQQLPEYKKLKALILSSQYLDYRALLRVLPSSRLLELRAVLLERLGRHLEALRIYVHQLHNLPLAEAYCDRAYQAKQASRRLGRWRRQLLGSVHGSAGAGGTGSRSSSVSSGGSGDSGRSRREAAGGAGLGGRPAPWQQEQAVSAAVQAGQQQAGWGGVNGSGGAGGAAGDDGDFDIYLSLIQVILEEPVPGTGEYRVVQRAPEDQRWAEVACLLSRKRDAISPLKALGLLPGPLPLPSALPFLEGALWGAAERRRAAALARSLRRCEHLQLLWELAQARQASILLTPERGCSLCYKRIGTSAFVAFPSGLLAHYSCYRRSSSSTGSPELR